jgi:hypothetical protein
MGVVTSRDGIMNSLPSPVLRARKFHIRIYAGSPCRGSHISEGYGTLGVTGMLEASHRHVSLMAGHILAGQELAHTNNMHLVATHEFRTMLDRQRRSSASV